MVRSVALDPHAQYPSDDYQIVTISYYDGFLSCKSFAVSSLSAVGPSLHVWRAWNPEDGCIENTPVVLCAVQ